MSRSKWAPASLSLVSGIIFAAALALPTHAQTSATVYEGARLITGGGGTIENSAFVVENGRFTQVGRRGELQLPAGAGRVDLTGKTVMPTIVDLHGHLGFQNIPAGTMSKETFTRENLIDHLQRLAFHGVGAVVGVGDLVDRSDMKGGRTGWGDVVLRVRDEIIPNAALFKTSGAGMAWPGAGAQGDPSRVDVAYPVATAEEARAAVRDYVRIKPEFIKIWVDDRAGRIPTLTPALYGAILDEAHKFNVPVAVHNVKQVDAKEMVRGGMEGWLHVPVRDGEIADDELIALVKDRVARNDRPNMWMTLSLVTRKMTPEQVARVKSRFDSDAKSAMRLRAAGIRVVEGTDTGQSRFLIGYFNHMDLESMVAMGLTPAEAIVAATRDGAEIAKLNTGLVAAGRNADFIVLDANPLERISNTRRINKVFLRGEEVPRAGMAAKWQAQFGQTAATGK